MSDPKNALRNLGGLVDTGGSGSLPSVPPVDNAGLYSFLGAIRKWVARASTGATRLVSVQDLTTAGLGATDADGNFIYSPESDLSVPAPPVGVVVAGNALSNLVTWQATPDSNVTYAEVWRATEETMSDGVLAGTTSAAVYLDVLSDAVQISVTYYYRVRFVRANGVDRVESTWSSATGVAATAELLDDAFIGSLNADKINAGTIAADRLSANTVFSKFFAADTVVAGEAFIQSAHITDAAVTNAKIGNEIKSAGYDSGAGWRVAKDGVMVTKSDDKSAVAGSYDYTEMTSGNVVNYTWFPEVLHQPQRALTRLEFGQTTPVTAGQTIPRVTLPGYWETQPVLLVSPASLQLYNAAARDSDQRIECYADDVRRLGTDATTKEYYQFSFQPVARITVDAAAGYIPVFGLVTVASTSIPYSESNIAARFVGAYSTQTQGSIPAFMTGGTLTISHKAADFTQVDFSDGVADGYLGLLTVEVLVDGVVRFTAPTIQTNYTEGTSSSFAVPALPAGACTIRMSLSSVKPWNNSGTAFALKSNGGLTLKVNSFNVTSSGGSYLAQGTLNWIALGR